MALGGGTRTTMASATKASALARSPIDAAHTSGVGFDIWGALLGLDFTPEDGSYDGSSFTRIRFWAKASPDSVTLVSAQLLESDWHYGNEVELSTSWREYVLVFDELPGEEGSPSRIDPSRLSAFQIFVLSGERFDLWIDEIVYFRERE